MKQKPGLCLLDIKHIVGESVVKRVEIFEELGKKEFYDYVEKRLQQKTEFGLVHKEKQYIAV